MYVFDIAQTEGAELPQHATVSGEVGAHHERLIDFVQQQAIELEYNERIAPAQGASYGGKIVLLPGQTKAEEFSTLVHELAHEMLHRTERRTITTKTVRETEAESIAFIVGRAVGLNTGRRARLHCHVSRQRRVAHRVARSHSASIGNHP